MTTAPSSQAITVLLVDDQQIVAAAIRRMLASETDIVFHHCQDPTQAIATAREVMPTVILQDLVMPEVDGLTLVKFFRANPGTRDVPLVVLSTKEEPTVKAQSFALGANDYLVKLPDRLELIARIRYHSRAHINFLERQEAYRRLEESQRQLAEEVAQAARYVQSLLPAPLQAAGLQTRWKFVPSTQLGGDSFSYHWLDPDHFAMYLLDVCGHGVGAALLSVSALNVLRSQALPSTNFRDPSQVVAGLNQAFPMEQQGDKYFTIWYGVYCRSERRLSYCGGGHPPALLFTGTAAGAGQWEKLPSSGIAVGMMEGYPFDTTTVELSPFNRLLLYSDGVYEIHLPGGKMWEFEDFFRYLTSLPPSATPLMEQLFAYARDLGGGMFVDDFSMLEVEIASPGV